MSEEKVSMFKEIEDNHPVYFTRNHKKELYCEDHRVLLVEDLYKLNGINKDIILEHNQAKFYQFFEENREKAYTLQAFIDCHFGVEESYEINDEKVERDLIRMVDEGKIKGVYYKSHYYFHL